MPPRSLLDDDDDTPTQEQHDVFDDAFEVDDGDFVADGFRPGYNHDREGSERQDHEHPNPSAFAPSDNHLPTPQTPMIRGPSRNSTRKSRSRNDNPFASSEDAADADHTLHRTPSGNFAPLSLHRSISSASSNQYARTRSSRLGAAGPTHPYAMYPQGTLARTSSVATASTAQPQRLSTAQGGPQHPYALYPQGVADDSDDDDDAVQNPVPVGFLGAGQQFQRRRGPDGEEQDILGFYGHTEQLPPYTRYPEDGPEKAPLLGIPEPPTALHSRAPVLGTDPGMPLMHAQLHSTAAGTPAAAPQSMTDETQLDRQSTRGSMLSAGSRAATSSLGTEQTTKSWSEKSWKERRRTTICGVPFWVIAVVAASLSFIAVLVGAVVGGYAVGQNKAKQQSQTSAASRTSLLDASLISTPTATSPVATSTWGLALGPAEQTQNGCLTDPEQRAAWGCELGDSDGIAINVGTVTGADTDGAALYYNTQSSISPLYYGTQASSMTTTWQPFLLVVDNDSPQDGSAFYFQGWYDKVVVIPEDAIHATHTASKTHKRNAYPTAASSSTQGPIATASSKPWLCYWNNTFVEGFIFPSIRAKHIASPATVTSARPIVTPTSSSVPAWAFSLDATRSATITTTLTMSSTTCTYTGVASAFPSWLHSNYPDFNMTEYLAVGPGRPNARRMKRNSSYGYPPWTNTQQLMTYPNLVKIEERRTPGSPPPYCLQFQVLDNGDLGPVTSTPNGPQNIVHLSEQDPGMDAYQDAGLADERKWAGGSRGKSRRTALSARGATVPGSCHCQWQSGL